MGKILEDKRSQLIANGRNGKPEKTDGKTRYEKRVKSRVSTSTSRYNKINMNELFKNNILTIDADVRGETDDYTVTMSFGGFLDKLQEQLKRNNDVLDLRIIVRALVESFDREDVYIHCSCPDWKYRMNFWSTVNKINSGAPENRPSKITNPVNDLGPGCKHVMLVLSNHNWLIKVASVINNYIKYFEKHRQREYADIIYPAVYGKKYEEPVQLDVMDSGSDNLDTSTDTIDVANKLGAVSGRFKSDETNPSVKRGLINKWNNVQPTDKKQIGIDTQEESDGQ